LCHIYRECRKKKTSIPSVSLQKTTLGIRLFKTQKPRKSRKKFPKSPALPQKESILSRILLTFVSKIFPNKNHLLRQRITRETTDSTRHYPQISRKNSANTPSRRQPQSCDNAQKPRLPAYYQEGFPKYQPPHEFPGIFVVAFPYSRDYFQFHSYFCFDRTTGINNSCSTENQEFLYKISNEEFSLQTQQAGVSSRKSRTRRKYSLTAEEILAPHHNIDK